MKPEAMGGILKDPSEGSNIYLLGYSHNTYRSISIIFYLGICSLLLLQTFIVQGTFFSMYLPLSYM